MVAIQVPFQEADKSNKALEVGGVGQAPSGNQDIMGESLEAQSVQGNLSESKIAKNKN